jgi:SAM-dependent methyltransferase
MLETAKLPQAVILDLGCGLGQNLRLLATHGVSTERMWALDRQAHLWGLGYELFRDHSRMRATFIHADFLQGSVEDQRFDLLRGQVDLVLASQFLHLFDWNGQLVACKKIVDLSKPGTMLVGFQQGRKRARAYIRPWGIMFYHNRDSFLQLWELVQQQTETQWTIDVREVPLQDWGMQDKDLEWMPEDHMGVNFVISRMS